MQQASHRPFTGLDTPWFAPQSFPDKWKAESRSPYLTVFAHFYFKTFPSFCAPFYPILARQWTKQFFCITGFMGYKCQLNFNLLSLWFASIITGRELLWVRYQNSPWKGLLMCWKKWFEKSIKIGTLMKLIWILSSASEVNSLPIWCNGCLFME